jgi:signal transduction histidine kinase
MRTVGFATWVVAGAPVLASVVRNPVLLERPTIAAWLAAFAVFGAAYSAMAAPGAGAGLRRTMVAVLAVSGLVANWLIPTPMPNIATTGILLVISASAAADVLSRRGALALVGLQTAGLLAGYAAAWPWEYAALAAGAYAVFQLFACGASLLARSEAEARAELAASLESLRATQAMLAQSAALAERARIDRELHDALGHNLVLLSLNLQAAAAACDASGPGAAGAGEMVRGCHALARLILSDLRGVVREGRGVAPVDLRAAVERLAAAAGSTPAVRATVDPGVKGLDAARAHALFRCAQEFITNTLKHAGATEATIDITRREGRVELHAADNGRGAAAIEPGGGLAGVRERVAELGGEVSVETAPGRGFRMTVTLPLPAEPGAAA